jgi:hypothetical protein
MRAYVHAVRQAAAGNGMNTPAEVVERWAQWALADAEIRPGRPFLSRCFSLFASGAAVAVGFSSPA